jgi:hypothetical protein
MVDVINYEIGAYKNVVLTLQKSNKIYFLKALVKMNEEYVFD